MAKSIVGLDVGHGVLRGAEVTIGGRGKPRLLRFHQVTFPVEAAREGEILEKDVLVRAIKQLWSGGKFSTKDVVIGIGNQRVLTRDLAVPKVPLERIRELLPFQVQDHLPIPVAEAVLDFYPVSEGVNETGAVINGLLVAAAKSAVLDNVHAVQAAGLNLIDVDLIPFALARALLQGDSTRGTVALVSVGAVTTSVVVATNGIPKFVRIIPSGSQDITNALVATNGITAAAADQIKGSQGLVRQAYDAGSNSEGDTVFRAAEELLSTIRASLAFYATNRPNDPIESLVVSGGGSRLRGFAAALEEVSRVRVDLGDPTVRLTVGRGVDSVVLPNI
ncbi:MAG: type IV pilus assembly protein PilM, partial [Rhodoglobus sp.]